MTAEEEKACGLWRQMGGSMVQLILALCTHLKLLQIVIWEIKQFNDEKKKREEGGEA